MWLFWGLYSCTPWTHWSPSTLACRMKMVSSPVWSLRMLWLKSSLENVLVVLTQLDWVLPCMRTDSYLAKKLRGSLCRFPRLVSSLLLPLPAVLCLPNSASVSPYSDRSPWPYFAFLWWLVECLFMCCFCHLYLFFAAAFHVFCPFSLFFF